AHPPDRGQGLAQAPAPLALQEAPELPGILILRAHSSMAEQPAHNRLGLGSSPGGPTIVAGAVRLARTAGGLRVTRVAPVRGQPGPVRGQRVAPVRGQSGTPVRAPLRIQWEKAWILSC